VKASDLAWWSAAPFAVFLASLTSFLNYHSVPVATMPSLLCALAIAVASVLIGAGLLAFPPTLRAVALAALILLFADFTSAAASGAPCGWPGLAS
jgi:hypothetical protein